MCACIHTDLTTPSAMEDEEDVPLRKCHSVKCISPHANRFRSEKEFDAHRRRCADHSRISVLVQNDPPVHAKVLFEKNNAGFFTCNDQLCHVSFKCLRQFRAAVSAGKLGCCVHVCGLCT